MVELGKNRALNRSRNRPPVDQPPLTFLSVLRSVPVTVVALYLGILAAFGAVGYLAAVALGLAWR